MRRELKAICVFCGSQTGQAAVYREQAAIVGTELASRGIRLIYGGGRVGLMGVVADHVLDNGGAVTGVIPEFLATSELMHESATEMHVVHDMHTRKATMARLSDAFVALPGGFGTLEELLEIITWAQLGLHRKPVGVLNVDGFFDPLMRLIDQAVETGFIRAAHRDLVLSDTGFAALLERMIQHELPATRRRPDDLT